MPSELKEAMEKTESLASKQLTSELRKATTSMGKAQRGLKDLMDAKERHRLQWLQHLADSFKGWQQQTGKLRLQARGIRASIPKAKKDMETAHVLVQTLKARAAGKTVPTPAEQVIPVDAAEDMSFIEDPEERSLRQKPHGLLAECATKMDVKENKTAEIVESSADEDKAARNAGQRPRHWTGKRAAASQPFCPHFLVNSPVSTRQSVSRNMTEL